jgi:hypothetical protein
MYQDRTMMYSLNEPDVTAMIKRVFEVAELVMRGLDEQTELEHASENQPSLELDYSLEVNG